MTNKLYVSCDTAVRVYDGSGDTLVAEISFRTYNEPTFLMPYPGTDRVCCIAHNGGTDTLYLIDGRIDSVVAKRAVGSFAREMCWNPAGGRIYVSCEHSLYVLSPTCDSVVKAWTVWPADLAPRLCAVPFPDKVYETRGHRLNVFDGNGEIIRSLDSANLDFLACDTDRGKVYGARDPVPVFDARGDTLLQTIAAQGDQWLPVAWNRTDSRVYVLSSFGEQLLVICDTTTAMAEPERAAVPPRWTGATVFRGRLFLNEGEEAVLLDLAGRRAASLRMGTNDVRMLKSGVYFLRPDDSAPIRKVVIQN